MQDSTQNRPEAQAVRALNASEIVANLARLDGWRLGGDGDAAGIEKTYPFGGYPETIAFVNAVAWIAQRRNHHPQLTVRWADCTVRYRTHSVAGISALDFDAARQVDALLAASS